MLFLVIRWFLTGYAMLCISSFFCPNGVFFLSGGLYGALTGFVVVSFAVFFCESGCVLWHGVR